MPHERAGRCRDISQHPDLLGVRPCSPAAAGLLGTASALCRRRDAPEAGHQEFRGLSRAERTGRTPVGRRADRFGRAGGPAGRSCDDRRTVPMQHHGAGQRALAGSAHRPRASSCGVASEFPEFGAAVFGALARKLDGAMRRSGRGRASCSRRRAFRRACGALMQREARHDRHVVGRLRSSRGLPSGSSISLQAGARPGVDQIWSSRRPRSAASQSFAPVAPPCVELLVGRHVLAHEVHPFARLLDAEQALRFRSACG